MEMQLTNWIIMENNAMRYDKIKYDMHALLFYGIIFEFWIIKFHCVSGNQHVFVFFIGSSHFEVILI